ncbi:unnamed protein product [Ectocarpus sp. 12 AP-2014]
MLGIGWGGLTMSDAQAKPPTRISFIRSDERGARRINSTDLLVKSNEASAVSSMIT